jgi:hypothetical protein
MNFRNALKLCLIKEYWVVTRVIESNHELITKIPLSLVEYMKSIELIDKATVELCEEGVCNVGFKNKKDLWRFEKVIFIYSDELSKEFGIISSNLNFENFEFKNKITKDYLIEIDNFFKLDEMQEVRIPSYTDCESDAYVQVGKNKLIYFVHNCSTSSVLIDW